MGCGGSTEKKAATTDGKAAAPAAPAAAAGAKPAGAKPAAAGAAYVADPKTPKGMGQTDAYKKFCKVFQPMTLFTPESKALRMTAWGAADPNGNGQCSLNELDTWIKTQLDEDCWKQFRPSYIRAFSDARDVGADKALGSGAATTDDFVQKQTFRLFIAYLVVYAEMYDAFDMVDGGGTDGKDEDRKISEAELTAGIPKLGGYTFASLQGLDATKATTLFKEMDTDGKGSIMLSEWCRWIEQNEQKMGTECGKLLAIGDDEKP